jgi:hypothetical protein
VLLLQLYLNNIIKKKNLVERAKVGHGSLLSGGCIEKQIRKINFDTITNNYEVIYVIKTDEILFF